MDINDRQFGSEHWSIIIPGGNLCHLLRYCVTWVHSCDLDLCLDVIRKFSMSTLEDESLTLSQCQKPSKPRRRYVICRILIPTSSGMGLVDLISERLPGPSGGL